MTAAKSKALGTVENAGGALATPPRRTQTRAEGTPKPSEPEAPKPPKHRAVLDHNRHVALEYDRDSRRVKYLGFDSRGVQDMRMDPREFDATFRKYIEKPVAAVALDLLRTLPSAYLPGDGVANTLLEIFTMTANEGKTGSELTLADLTANYNALAAALGRAPVKSFKSKGEALKRIAAAKEEAAKPTAAQVEARVKADEKIEKAAAARKAKVGDDSDAGGRAIKAAAAALSGEKPKATRKAAKADKSAKAAKFPAAAKKAASKKPATGRAPKGTGIGAFCTGLIEKGKSNEEVLEAVRKKFPEAATSASSVAWYRNKLKSEGKA